MTNSGPTLDDIKTLQKLLRSIEKMEKDLSKKYAEAERLQLKLKKLYKEYNTFMGLTTENILD